MRLFIALLFHISGVIGILFTPYKDWFIKNTLDQSFINGCICLFLHILQKIKISLLFLLCYNYCSWFFVEVIRCKYRFIIWQIYLWKCFGIKILNVPLIIGVNWFIIIYCTGMITQSYENYMLKKINEKGMIINQAHDDNVFYN